MALALQGLLSLQSPRLGLASALPEELGRSSRAGVVQRVRNFPGNGKYKTCQCGVPAGPQGGVREEALGGGSSSILQGTGFSLLCAALSSWQLGSRTILQLASEGQEKPISRAPPSRHAI